MRAEVIAVSELDDYLRFERLRQDLTTRLHLFHKTQEQQLERQKEIKVICEQIANIKRVRGFKLDADMKKEILKHIHHL